jgi:pimeloyl-ACP methyl ester carboxylesterase
MSRRPVHTDRIELTGDGVRLVGDRWSGDRDDRGTLLFLHGGGQTRHSWRHSAARFAEQGWTSLALDTRGHGQSQWAPDGDYTMDALVADLRSVLRQLQQPPVLVGASLGGMTSLLIEGEHPGSARALVLVDVVPRLEPEGVERIRSFMTSRPDGFATLEEVAEAVRAYTPERTRPVNVEGLKKNLRFEDGRWYWHWDPAFLAAGEEPRRDVDHGRLSRAAAAIEIPTLVVHGRHSDVVSQRGIDELLEVLPHARTADVSDAGHMVAGDDNDVFTTRLADFLRSDVEDAARDAPQRRSG